METRSRIFGLLEEALTTERLPEDICAGCPELLQELRTRIQQCVDLDSRIDELFPSSGDGNSSSDEAIAIPQIDGYVITDVLGRGGAGIVYRAQQISLNRAVAIKMLVAGRYSTKTELRRLSREARAVGRLRHPNIVQVYDVSSVGAQPYFTMELVESGTLAKQLGGHPLNVARAAALAITLASAVDAAHKVGIVHRDLKPANILLTADGSPKITDFGLARDFSDDLMMLTISNQVGTPSYMAPEQVRGTREATDPLVDIYALGAILYECLTGRPPFRGQTSAHTHQQVLAIDPIPPSKMNPKVPRDLETICLKCLSKSGSQRYATAIELAAELQRFLDDEPILARPTGRGERLFKWARRHPTWATAIAAAVTVLVVGTFALMRLRAVQQDRLRAIEADLTDVAAYENHEQWSKAHQVLQRDLDSLGGTFSNGMGPRLHAAECDLDLVARLDAIHLNRVTGGNLPVYRMKADGDYRNAFKDYLSLSIGDPLEVAASKINRSPVRALLAVGVNDWATSVSTTDDRRWLLKLAKSVQPADREGWINRICDADQWASASELKDLFGAVRVDRVPISVLLIFADRLKETNVMSSTEFLRRVQRENPSDFWVNLQLGTDMLWINPNISEAYCRAALALRPDAAVGYTALADALRHETHAYDAISAYRQALKLDPTSAWTRNSYGNAFADIGRFDEALICHDRALKDDPQYSWADYDAGDTLMKMHRANDAAHRFQKAVHSSLDDSQLQRNLRVALIMSGHTDDTMKAWKNAIEADPSKYEIVAGYAELCAYLNRRDDYESARQGLMQIAEQISDNNQDKDNSGNLQAIISACLLEPAPDAILTKLSVFIKHQASRPDRPASAYPRYRFNQALLAYRQNHPKETTQLLGGADHESLGPMPRLLLAMALSDLGDPKAKDIMADVSFHYDWRPANITGRDLGAFHVLRREAESKFVPDITGYLRSQKSPAERYDRLILIGLCNENVMNAFAARLYKEAFDVEPALGRVAARTVRYQGACAEVASGEPSRRALALGWLTDDLSANLAAMPAPRSQACAWLEHELGLWQNDPDLANVREPNALQHLPVDERQAWQTLWCNVAAAMDRLEQ